MQPEASRDMVKALRQSIRRGHFRAGGDEPHGFVSVTRRLRCPERTIRVVPRDLRPYVVARDFFIQKEGVP